MSLPENSSQHWGGACCHHPQPVAVTLNVCDHPLLTLSNIGMTRSGRNVLTDVNLCINRGDFVAITGPNGGGKTTLLRIILGLLKPTTGQVIFNGSKPTIGYLPQKNLIDSQFPLTVHEVVQSGLLGTHGLSNAERRQRTIETIERIELQKHAQNSIGQLSGGQLQRALLGRAIISRPDLLVLDEPLSYIDKHFEAHIYRLLAEYAPHCTTLLVSHEMSTIDSMANRHWLVDNTITECSAPHHYITTPCDWTQEKNI